MCLGCSLILFQASHVHFHFNCALRPCFCLAFSYLFAIPVWKSFLHSCLLLSVEMKSDVLVSSNRLFKADMLRLNWRMCCSCQALFNLTYFSVSVWRLYSALLQTSAVLSAGSLCNVCMSKRSASASSFASLSSPQSEQQRASVRFLCSWKWCKDDVMFKGCYSTRSVLLCNVK